jgi:GNAT superfamily N-acetyltransferase
VLWDDWSESHNWKEITGAGTFANHNPHGRTLYGAEIFVDPTLRGEGIGHLLYEGRRALCRAMNLKRIIACGRLLATTITQMKSAPSFMRRKSSGGSHGPCPQLSDQGGLQLLPDHGRLHSRG